MLIAAYQSAPCPTPKKQRYTTEAEAYVAADYIFDTQDCTLEPYYCPCGLWHLTTPMGLKGQQTLTPPPTGGTRSAQRKAWLQPGTNRAKSSRRPRRVP